MRKLKRRKWFEKGGRHAFANRTEDLRKILDIIDVRQMSAIDIGAAEGDISIWLSTMFDRVVAIELMDDAYRRLCERAAEIPSLAVAHADIAEHDLTEMYDCVFLLGVLHYFLDDDVKAKVIEKCLQATRYGCFVRTGIRDYKLRDGLGGGQLQKFTPMRVYREAAKRYGAELAIIDHSGRGQGKNRLGDLAIFRMAAECNPLPRLDVLVSGFNATIQQC